MNIEKYAPDFPTLASLKVYQKWFLLLLKTGISLVAFVYIYSQLVSEGLSWGEWQQILNQQGETLCLLALMMVPLNWGLEAAKWFCMLRPLFPGLSFSVALKAIFTGIATGMFTPNRIGEYAGRLWSLPQEQRPAAATYTFTNRIYQMLITLSAGAIACEYFFHFQPEQLIRITQYAPAILNWLRTGLWLGCVLAWIFVLTPRLIKLLFLRFLPPRSWVVSVRSSIDHISLSRLWKVIGLSGLRYTVFSSQYILLMYTFGYDGSPGLAIAMISLIFLIKSVIPFISVAELGVREALAVTIMGAFDVTASTAFSSTFVLYVFNIILPTLLGLIFVLRLK